jgi:C-terminal processing protease CtpA/Prc
MQDAFDGREARVRVRSTELNSPSERAGLCTGDTILSIDGLEIRGVRDVYKVGFKVGQAYVVRVRRPDGSVASLTITPEPEKEERFKRLFG